jgi:DNA topoisomerase I
MEEELDEIEGGSKTGTDALTEFYGKFEKDLSYAEKHMENIKRMEKQTDQKCERCGAPLVIKWGKHGSFFACSTYVKKDPESCTFTKENPINLTDLDQAEMQSETEDEYCENCGKAMVLKRGRFGQFMACTGYPECKTTRRLDQAKKVPDVPLDEKCPECDRNLILRHGRFGEFTSCSGYPDCKWIKQNFIGVKCPECKVGEIVEKKARRGNFFYGCSTYPKCDFTSANRPVAEECPECHSPYLVEKTLKDGVYLSCPNNKSSAAAKKPRKGKKKVEEKEAVVCDFSKRIGDAPTGEAQATA